MADARARLAAYLGADADEVVYFPNVTSALNAVARSLPLEPGDEILTTDHEYGAIHRTWTFLSEHRQAPLSVQPFPLPVADPEAVVEQVWAGVTPRTRVLVLSHVTSPTALTFPIRALIQRAREAGIWTAIDGAHAAGQVAGRPARARRRLLRRQLSQVAVGAQGQRLPLRAPRAAAPDRAASGELGLAPTRPRPVGLRRPARATGHARPRRLPVGSRRNRLPGRA